MNYVLEGLKTAGQFPLDYKIWYKTQDDITLGEDNYLAYSFYLGMMVYCAEERVMFEWTDVDNPNIYPGTPVLLMEHFTYPADFPSVEGVEYAGKQFNFFKVVIDNAHVGIENYVLYGDFRNTVDELQAQILENKVDIANLSEDLRSKIDTVDEAIRNLKTYTDAQNEALEKELELREKALRGELTAAEAKLLLELENQRRDLIAEINRQSELILNSVDELKKEITKEVNELNSALNNLQDQLNSLPTDTELTERQIDSLVQLLNTVEVEFYDVIFKITVVLRDKFLPANQKPALEALEVETRQKYNVLKTALENAIKDKILTEVEVKDINTKLESFKETVKKVNEDLVAIYDVLGDAKKKYYDDKISETIVDTELIVEYSPYPDRGWHIPPYREEDIYMRQKNGPQGDWYGPIRIKGENGENGQYTDYQFAKNKDLNNPPTSGWLDTPPVANADEYIWSRVGTVIPPATTPPYWTAMRMTGPKGQEGPRGEPIVSATEPPNKYVGMVWIDTSKTPIEQKYWNGTIWILTGISQSDIAKAIKDANDALQKTMEDALKDGIIDANEAQVISSNLSALDTNKRILDAQYVLLYADPNLGATAKTNLQAKKVDFEAKHKALYDLCLAISKKTSVTVAEQNDYKTKQTAYNTSLGEYSKALELAQQDILKNTVGNIQSIGRNLLSLSNEAVTTTNYAMKNYKIVDPEMTIKVGEVYTVTIWGTLGAGKTGFGLYNSGGNVNLGTAVKVEEGVYQASFIWKNTSGSNTVTPTTVNVYAVPNTVTSSSSIKYVKMEKGPIGSEWSVAIEDIEDAARLASLNAAQAEAAALQIREQLNFLGNAKFDGNSVIAGLLLVGDAKGNNGFFSGITDKANGESIRIGIGGQGYKNKESAVFKVRDNGKLEATNAIIKGNITATSGFFGGFKITFNSFESANGVYHVDSTTGMQTLKDSAGNIRNRKGLDENGEPMDTWYDVNGDIVYSLTSKGIIYANFVKESYTKHSYFKITAVTVVGATPFFNALRKKQGGAWTDGQPQGPYTEYQYTTIGVSPGNQNGYTYSAGNNPESENNKQYEGFYYASENKLGAKVPDGWYVTSKPFTRTYGQMKDFNSPDPERPDMIVTSAFYDEFFTIVRFLDGKIVESKSCKANLNMTYPNISEESIPFTNIEVV